MTPDQIFHLSVVAKFMLETIREDAQWQALIVEEPELNTNLAAAIQHINGVAKVFADAKLKAKEATAKAKQPSSVEEWFSLYRVKHSNSFGIKLEED